VIESDSEPSCDNFDEEELVKRFEVAVSDDELEVIRPKKKEEKLPEPKEEPKVRLREPVLVVPQ